MSKHHIENLVKQIANKGHGSAPFHQENTHYQTSEAVKSEDISTKVAEEDNSLEAERSLRKGWNK